MALSREEVNVVAQQLAENISVVSRRQRDAFLSPTPPSSGCELSIYIDIHTSGGIYACAYIPTEILLMVLPWSSRRLEREKQTDRDRGRGGHKLHK